VSNARGLIASPIYFGNQVTVDRIKALIGDLQAQKATLHPEPKQ
jgi:hypothetical protein